VGYTLFHPYDKPSFLLTDVDGENRILFASIASLLFISAEFMNLMCHAHFSCMEEKMAAAVLQNAQEGKKDTRSRARRSYLVQSISKFAILKDYGFSLVTCADWMWELVSWICLALIV